MLLLIGLGLGILLAFLVTLKSGHRKKGVLITMGLSPWIFLYVASEYDFDLKSTSDLGTVAILAFMLSIALTSLLLIKHLRIAIDEWEYVAHVSIVIFIISYLYEWWLLVLVPFGIATILPLFMSNVLSKSARMLYYLSYSAMSVVIFALLVGFEIFDPVLTETNVVMAFLQLVAIGWVLYIYLVQAILVVTLVDPRFWKHLGDVHVHFKFTRRYPVFSLLTLFAVCTGGLWVLSLYTTLLNSVVAISIVLSISSYVIHWYYGQQYLFTPQSVLRK